MPHVTRRSFLAGAAAIPFSVWLEKYSWAQPAAPRVRFDARSPQGLAMLKIYAQAVNKMQTATAEGDPRSWVFQWYTHAVKSSTSKTAEIARIYPTASPQRSLALETWNTCQPHGGQDSNYFLPWHRMFVYFFENIIRGVSGNATFTLPYWNYSTPDATIHGVMPTQFRLPTDVTFKPLFVSKRNSGVNSGQAIDKGQPSQILGLSSLAECTYEPKSPRQGFCMNIDRNLHGNVHGLVGNGLNMGAVPWAAGDPIFWMHHSNIDRLWASWNAGGRKNLATSSFLAKTFVFADANGQRVVAKIQDFLDVAKLGYSYDRLEPVPPCPPTPGLGAAPAAPPATRARVKAPVPLTTAPVRVALELPPALGAAPAVPLADRVRSLAGRHLFLVLKGLRAQVQPEVLYHVYLELPPGTVPQGEERHYVGTVNFFDSVGLTGHEDHPVAAAPVPDKFFSFDVTALAKDLLAKGQLSAKPALTIVPAGQPVAEAKPVLGEIALVEQ
jgi:tyrosinase